MLDEPTYLNLKPFLLSSVMQMSCCYCRGFFPELLYLRISFQSIPLFSAFDFISSSHVFSGLTLLLFLVLFHKRFSLFCYPPFTRRVYRSQVILLQPGLYLFYLKIFVYNVVFYSVLFPFYFSYKSYFYIFFYNLVLLFSVVDHTSNTYIGIVATIFPKKLFLILLKNFSFGPALTLISSFSLPSFLTIGPKLKILNQQLFPRRYICLCYALIKV